MLKFKVEGATRYSFKDDKTGRLVEGINVYYLNDAVQNENAIGRIPAKVSLPIDAWGQVSQLRFPVECEAQIEQYLTSKGVKSKVVGIQPVK